MYCSPADLQQRFGEQELTQLTDRNGSGSPDAALLQKAIDDASAEINGYLRGRVALPLADVPPELAVYAADMARYRLYTISPTDEVSARYDKAIGWLRRVSEGRLTLVTDDPANSGDDAVQFESAPSIFARGTR